MAHHLVVTQEFGGRAIGERITDASEIETVLAEHPAQVVRVLADDTAAPAALAAPPEDVSDAALAAPPK